MRRRLMARRMIKTSLKISPAIGAAIAALLLLMSAALLLGLVAIDRPLPSIDDAVSATATINGQRIKPGEMSNGKFPTRSSNRYFVHLAFVDSEGKAEAHEVELGQAGYNSHLPGSKVTVWYFPGRPQVTLLNDPAKLVETGSRFGLLLGGVLAVLGTCMGMHFGNRLFMARRGYSAL
jgi:hypothetical protein